jgi:hypothetical protein
MEAAGNSITDLNSRHPVADRGDLTRAIGKRYDAELGRTAGRALRGYRRRREAARRG